MTIRTIAGIAFAIFATFGCTAAARADQVFCAASIRYLTPATPQASSDTTYDVLLRTYGSGEITHAKLAVLDGKREYEVSVPVGGKHAGVEEFSGIPITEFQPIALHFSKPISVEAVWIEEVGDDAGNVASCLPDAAVPAESAKDPDIAKVFAQLDAKTRQNPVVVSVPQQDGLLFLTPENCSKKYVDAHATGPVIPDYPRVAAESVAGRVTVLVRVNVRPDGELASASIEQSSGNIYLDRAALNAAKQSTYAPKKIDCIPFAGTYIFRATFDPNG